MILNGGALNSGPLNAPAGPPFVDWAAGLSISRIFYVLDIEHESGDIRIPISSWQATLQQGRSSYVQAVIPAAADWMPQVSARKTGGMIVVSRGGELTNGETVEQEIARAPLQQVRFQRGPNRTTVMVSGYAAPVAPANWLTRDLHEVRSITIEPGMRVRCGIDWFLRPGHTARLGDDVFSVAYINYYGTHSEAYMDVGERLT